MILDYLIEEGQPRSLVRPIEGFPYHLEKAFIERIVEGSKFGNDIWINNWMSTSFCFIEALFRIRSI